MLEIKGPCCSGLDAIEFMESLAALLDDEVKTVEFCEEYERSLNRFRHEVNKGIPKSLKRIKRKYGKGEILNCGNCGYGITEATNNYCANCGNAIKR